MRLKKDKPMDKVFDCDIVTGEEQVMVPEAEIVSDLPAGIPPLRTFYLYLSDSCNLHCRHCWITPTYANGKPTPGEVIDTGQLKSAVQEGKSLGLNGAKFTGGEPMLHPEFRQIASLLTEEGLRLSLETNGTLINRDIARFIKNETSIYFISVSLDSPLENSHDTFRGSKGAYRATLRGLRYLIEAGFKNTQIIMSVHRRNITEVRELVALAEASGAASVKLNPVTNNGRGAQMHENNETLNFSEILELSNLVRGNLKQSAAIPVMLNVPLSLRPLSEITSPGGFNSSCGIDHIIGILGSGDIALCGIGRTMPEFVYGNIASSSIRDIWLNHPAVINLRLDLKNFDNYPDLCRSCIFLRKCRTGCVVINYSNYGKLIWPNDLCLKAEEAGLFKESRKRTTDKRGA